MTRNATLIYDVHKSHRQAFDPGVGGAPSNLISPQLTGTSVTLADNRITAASVSFACDAFEITPLKTQVRDFGSDRWKPICDLGQKAMLQNWLGAQEVVVFDHAATCESLGNVHIDYSKDEAEQRLVDLLAVDIAAEEAQGRHATVDPWRAVDHPINPAHVGFVRTSAVELSDWNLLDLVYPDRKGQTIRLVESPEHEWIYHSKMTPDEVAIFNIYDNHRLPSIAHSALYIVEDSNVTTIRKSIEKPTLVRQ
ncbi:MAG: CmcJ/NvfI family oxidoreductase [Pseudomonadota bacterium]